MRLKEILSLVGMLVVPMCGARAEVSLITFDEALKKQVPVSGSVIAGLVATIPDSKIGDSPLALFVPESGEGNYCVSLVSRDGMYSASAQYSVTNVRAGVYEIPFPTTFRAELSDKYQAELAVLARYADTCNQTGGPIVVAQWGTEQAARVVSLYVNSARTVSQVELEEPRRSSSCSLLSDANLISFDTVCSIDAALVGRVKGGLTRKRFRNSLPQVEFEFALPGLPSAQ